MTYTYPKSFKIKSNKKQYELLCEHFPTLKTVQVTTNTTVGGEGIFLVPHWKLLGKTYNEAVLAVLKALKDSRPTYDWRSGNWTEAYLKQLPVKEHFWNSQKEEILLLSAQFGQKHAGTSVHNVRTGLETNELPLGIYEVGIMLLTHPERLQASNDLWIDCPGDEYSPDADGAFSRAPFFRFSDGGLHFGAHDASNASAYYGSASGFVPQPLGTRTLESSESFTLERAIEICKENGLKAWKEM